MNGFKKKNTTTADSDHIGQTIISNSHSLVNYLDGRASISASGWGVPISAEFAAKSGINYQSDQLIIVAYRDIKFGVEGMVTGQYPSFTPDARDILCQDPNAFRQIYGTHFIKGEDRGASIEMRVEITTKNHTSVEEVHAKLEATGSDAGVTATGSAHLD